MAPENKVAYVEPVATDPDYRRMGLGKAAVLGSQRNHAKLDFKTDGANYVWVPYVYWFYNIRWDFWAFVLEG